MRRDFSEHTHGGTPLLSGKVSLARRRPSGQRWRLFGRRHLLRGEPPAAQPKEADAVWLAPWEVGKTNQLTLYFDLPVSVALLRVLNYSKTPARGVQEFELLAEAHAAEQV